MRGTSAAACDAVKDEMQHGEWMPWIAEIGMGKDTARRFMWLAEGIEIAQLAQFESVDAALKALPPKRQKEDPAPETKATEPPAESADPPAEAVTGDVLSDAEAEAAMNEAAAEHEEQRDPAAEREARDERLSVRLENSDGEAVEALAGQLDKADTRHHDDVGAVNDARKAAAVERRKNREICDALLAIPRGKEGNGVDDVLMRFFLVQRK